MTIRDYDDDVIAYFIVNEGLPWRQGLLKLGVSNEPLPRLMKLHSMQASLKLTT